jgi:hypothetical protein
LLLCQPDVQERACPRMVLSLIQGSRAYPEAHKSPLLYRNIAGAVLIPDMPARLRPQSPGILSSGTPGVKLRKPAAMR